MAITLAAAVATATTALGTASAVNGVITACYSFVQAIENVQTTDIMESDLLFAASTVSAIIIEPSRSEYLNLPLVIVAAVNCVEVIKVAMQWFLRYRRKNRMKKWINATMYMNRFVLHTDRVFKSLLLFTQACTMHSLRTPSILTTRSSDCSDIVNLQGGDSPISLPPAPCTFQ